MPAVFFGHGSPMNALEMNRFTTAWRTFGQTIPKPRAILVVSAHWYERDRSDSDASPPHHPRLLRFPGATVRGRVSRRRQPRARPGSRRNRQANARRPRPRQLGHFDSHFELGARLAPLRERGVLIVGSGNVVHNLCALNWSEPDLGFDRTRRFDDAARAALTQTPSDVPALRSHGDYAKSAPTPDHFIPLLYIAGLASAATRPLELLIDGYAFGSLSMAAYTLDAKCPTDHADSRRSAGLPDPEVMPAADTNI
jgi:4,5-DOPA dioxygenase extradiol